jgi:hypothetical protein
MDNSLPTFTDEELYKGLQALSDLSFPKICNTCGKRYETVEEFLNQTESIRQSSGLKESLDDDDRVIVGLFRNCTCGSTLLDEFNNRRNLSKVGIKRREKFGELIDKISSKGIPYETARRELLKVMRGEGSELLKVTCKKT